MDLFDLDFFIYLLVNKYTLYSFVLLCYNKRRSGEFVWLFHIKFRESGVTRWKRDYTFRLRFASSRLTLRILLPRPVMFGAGPITPVEAVKAAVCHSTPAITGGMNRWSVQRVGILY